MKCAMERRATRGEDTGGRHGGTKRCWRSNLGKTWPKFLGNKITEGNRERDPNSKN